MTLVCSGSEKQQNKAASMPTGLKTSPGAIVVSIYKNASGPDVTFLMSELKIEFVLNKFFTT